jgi:hypothetical protein
VKMAVKTPPISMEALSSPEKTSSSSIPPLPTGELAFDLDAIERDLSPPSEPCLDLDAVMAKTRSGSSPPRDNILAVETVETGSSAIAEGNRMTEAEMPSGNGEASGEGMIPIISKAVSSMSSTRGKDKEKNVATPDMSELTYTGRDL